MAIIHAYFNFLDGTYEVLGAPVVVTDNIQNRPGTTIPFIIDAQGLAQTASFGTAFSAPEFIGDLLTEILALANGNGFTYVCSYIGDGPAPEGNVGILSVYNAGFTAGMNCGTGPSQLEEIIQIFPVFNSGEEIDLPIDGPHVQQQVAILFDNIRGVLSISSNGGPVYSLALPDQGNALSQAGCNFGTLGSGWQQYFAYYDPVAPALLPQLSTIGFIPPPSLDPPGPTVAPVANLNAFTIPHNGGLWR